MGAATSSEGDKSSIDAALQVAAPGNTAPHFAYDPAHALKFTYMYVWFMQLDGTSCVLDRQMAISWLNRMPAGDRLSSNRLQRFRTIPNTAHNEAHLHTIANNAHNETEDVIR